MFIRRPFPACSRVPFLALILFGAAALAISSAHAQTFTVLHLGNNKTGSMGGGELFIGPGGTLFGTTGLGGTGTDCFHGTLHGCGTVFQLSPAGHYKVLYSFLGGSQGLDGESPYGGVIRDSAGNLYGTTSRGGPYQYPGFGTVFKLDATGKETILHAFTGGADGSGPSAGLVRDQTGSLYGTTGGGGNSMRGTIFKLDAAGNETVLHNFTGGSDGGSPLARLLLDINGNFYGTASEGGDLSCGGLGCGVVFKLDSAGNYSVLHSFNQTDGSFPNLGLVRDSRGNLYGTTFLGGTADDGVIFKIDSAGNYSVLYNFLDDVVGAFPNEIVVDSQGNLYGTAQESSPGFGTVYKLDTTGSISVLHTFNNTDGQGPSRLLLDKSGVLYGTTAGGGLGGCNGGSTCGVIFSIAP